MGRKIDQDLHLRGFWYKWARTFRGTVRVNAEARAGVDNLHWFKSQLS